MTRVPARTFTTSQRADFLFLTTRWKKSWLGFWPLHLCVPIPAHEGSALMTLLSPKGPPPDIITLGIGFQHRDSRATHSIHCWWLMQTKLSKGRWKFRSFSKNVGFHLLCYRQILKGLKQERCELPSSLSHSLPIPASHSVSRLKDSRFNGDTMLFSCICIERVLSWGNPVFSETFWVPQSASAIHPYVLPNNLH